MKSRARKPLAALAVLALLSTVNPQLSTVFAQGTAFTYQGQLQNNGVLASGTYNLTFILFTNNAGGTAVAGPVTNSGVGVSNGLFTVIIDFGAGPWNGETNWLEIGVETNGTSSFTTLTPRQQVTPTPYAIYAESVPASGLSGSLLDSQLLHSAVTINPGPGLSGGGKVGLGNTITLTNIGVLSVTGNADITATTVGGNVTLGDTGTNTDTPNSLVKRDGSGSFSAATIALDGNLNLPATTTSAGIINLGGLTLVHAFGTQNFFTGPNAGNLTMSGHGNTGNGYVALEANAGGNWNTADGAYALLLNTSGSNNTACGAQALYSNTNGSGNTATGDQALYYNAGSAFGNGSYNTANGWQALYSNRLGSFNTAIGSGAMYSNVGDTNGNGSYNTANGYAALEANTFGAYNTAIGYLALSANTVGSGNTANGAYALLSNQGNGVGGGNNNTAIGYGALQENTVGENNTAIGFFALSFNTVGSGNTANGTYALTSNQGDGVGGGNNNTANGYQALYSNTNGYGNTANGYQALYFNAGGNGDENTANGDRALYSNTDGYDNTASGWLALYSNTSGNNNTANGGDALSYNTTGGFNTANGVGALQFNTVGSFNAANGDNSLYSNTNGSFNTANGNNALYVNYTGSNNTANGSGALYHNANGSYNTADGVQALDSNTSGNNNIALGYQAGFNLTTGDNNIDIGNSGVAGEANTIRIGTTNVQTRTYFAGISGVTISPAGAAVFVNSAGELGTVNSSRRYKEDIQDIADQSDVILSLRPVAFRYKHELDPLGTRQFGLIAEEVEKVAPELVLRDEQGKIYSVRYEQINAMLLNEFIKQHHAVEKQSEAIENLKQQNESLEKRLDELQKAIGRVAEKLNPTVAFNSTTTESK